MTSGLASSGTHRFPIFTARDGGGRGEWGGERSGKEGEAARRGEADSSWVSRAVAYTVRPFGLRGVRTGIGPIWSPSADGSLWSSALFFETWPSVASSVPVHSQDTSKIYRSEQC
jgi:hypothetical protein